MHSNESECRKMDVLGWNKSTYIVLCLNFFDNKSFLSTKQDTTEKGYLQAIIDGREDSQHDVKR